MSNKRAVVCLSDQDEPPHKKRKKSNNDKDDPWKLSYLVKNNITQHAVDGKQYNSMFESVIKSGIIIKMNVPKGLVKIISDLAMGNSINCWTKNCDEKLSFLNNEKWDGLELGLKCKECDTFQYSAYCDICRKECSSLDDTGMYCDDCQELRCHPHLDQCKNCGKWWCTQCWDLENNNSLCYECVESDHELNVIHELNTH